MPAKSEWISVGLASDEPTPDDAWRRRRHSLVAQLLGSAVLTDAASIARTGKPSGHNLCNFQRSLPLAKAALASSSRRNGGRRAAGTRQSPLGRSYSCSRRVCSAKGRVFNPREACRSPRSSDEDSQAPLACAGFRAWRNVAKIVGQGRAEGQIGERIDGLSIG